MLTLAIGAAGASVLWTALVVFARVVSTAPLAAFVRAWALLACWWLVTACLFLWWALA